MMKLATPNATPRIVRLADQLAEDIATRGLLGGESYLGTAEAARLLGVSTAAANRAMQLLAQRRILERRQGRGAVVAHQDVSRSEGFACIHLLVRKDYMKQEGLLADGLVLGLQGQLPHAQMQFNFLPDYDEHNFVASLVARAAQAQEPQGFVLVRSSFSTQRQFEESGLPTVLGGSPYPSIERIPSLDRDNLQAGRVLAEYVLASREHLVVLLRDRISAGDHAFLIGIFEAAAQRGVAANEISLQCLPPDRRAVAGVLRSLPLRSKTGVICRSQPLGEAAAEFVASQSAAIRRSTCIAIADVYRRNGGAVPLAHLELEIDPQEYGRRLGVLLLGQQAGAAPVHERIPVRLVRETEYGSVRLGAT